MPLQIVETTVFLAEGRPGTQQTRNTPNRTERSRAKPNPAEPIVAEPIGALRRWLALQLEYYRVGLATPEREVLTDDNSEAVPKERTWLITCGDGEAMLVALNPEFRGTSRRDNWHAVKTRRKKPAPRGPPKVRY